MVGVSTYDDYFAAEAEQSLIADAAAEQAKANARPGGRRRGYQSDARPDPGHVAGLQRDLADAKAKAAASHPDTYLAGLAATVDAVRPGGAREPGISRREREIREQAETEAYWKRRAAELDKKRAQRLFAELHQPAEQPRAPFPF